MSLIQTMSKSFDIFSETSQGKVMRMPSPAISKESFPIGSDQMALSNKETTERAPADHSAAWKNQFEISSQIFWCSVTCTNSMRKNELGTSKLIKWISMFQKELLKNYLAMLPLILSRKNLPKSPEIQNFRNFRLLKSFFEFKH